MTDSTPELREYVSRGREFLRCVKELPIKSSDPAEIVKRHPAYPAYFLYGNMFDAAESFAMAMTDIGNVGLDAHIWSGAVDMAAIEILGTYSLLFSAKKTDAGPVVEWRLGKRAASSPFGAAE